MHDGHVPLFTQAVFNRRPQPGTRHKKFMPVSDTCEQSVSEGKTQTEATGRCRKERAHITY